MAEFVAGIWGLLLPGWEDLSTWGYDLGAASFYAQLTRNGNTDDDGPDIWITPGRYPVITSSHELLTLIAAETGESNTAVAAAMNHAIDFQGAPANYRTTA